MPGPSRGRAAERALAAGRAAGFDTEIEASETQRDRTSEWVRRIGVSFNSGETGDDAKEFRATVHAIVEQSDGGHSRAECHEQSVAN
jgi:hypothetical protein